MTHRTKAVCSHGRPWYALCLDCQDEQHFPTGATTKFGFDPATGVYYYQISNRDAFFTKHPDAARELTR